MTTFTMTK